MIIIITNISFDVKQAEFKDKMVFAGKTVKYMVLIM